MKTQHFAVFLLFGVLAGCGDADGTTPSGASKAASLQVDDGSNVLATQSSTSPTLPSYVPIYPGATNRGGGMMAINNAGPVAVTKTMVNFTTPDTVDQVVNFYAAQLPANAVQVDVMRLSADAAMVSGVSSAVEPANGVDAATVSVAVTRDGTDTVIGISIDQETRNLP